MAVGAKKATLADPVFAQEVSGCVMGAVPPFALSPGIRLVIDSALLSSNEEIAFDAGRLDRSIVLATGDYVRIARPQLATSPARIEVASVRGATKGAPVID